MHLESPSSRIQKSQKEVYEFLSDLGNFRQLMPESIETFELIDEDQFRFALKGMPEIKLKRKEATPFNKIVLGAASDKLPFTLTANIHEISPGESEVLLSFEGAFNAMMAMMIKGPITNFLGTLSDNIGKIG